MAENKIQTLHLSTVTQGLLWGSRPSSSPLGRGNIPADFLHRPAPCLASAAWEGPGTLAGPRGLRPQRWRDSAVACVGGSISHADLLVSSVCYPRATQGPCPLLSKQDAGRLPETRNTWVILPFHAKAQWCSVCVRVRVRVSDTLTRCLF